MAEFRKAIGEQKRVFAKIIVAVEGEVNDYAIYMKGPIANLGSITDPISVEDAIDQTMRNGNKTSAAIPLFPEMNGLTWRP